MGKKEAVHGRLSLHGRLSFYGNQTLCGKLTVAVATTTDPDQVTCRACRRTKVFRRLCSHVWIQGGKRFNGTRFRGYWRKRKTPKGRVVKQYGGRVL